MQIKVGPFVYQVIFHNGSDAKIDSEQEWGYCDHEKFEIHVVENVHYVAMVDTLIHEILHAVAHTYGISHHILTEKIEEKVVSQMATGLTDVLMRNPDLLDFFNMLQMHEGK